MQEYKKTRSVWGIFVLMIVILIAGVFIYFTFFLSAPMLDDNLVETAFQEDEDYCYFYEKMDEDNQDIYKNILYALQQFEEEVILPSLDVKDIQTALEYVIYDHPELYYVHLQFQYQDMKKYMIFMPQYVYTKEEVDKYNKKIEQNTSDILKSVSKEDSITKAKRLYDFVISENEYKNNKKTDQNVISSLIEGKTVCAGYARAYQYLMNRAGEQCAYIVGTANESNSQTQTGDGHAWTMVKTGDDYYYCDPTWGDCEESGYAHTCNGYFMMNSRDMLLCYSPGVSYEKTTGNINYFKQESLYMTTYSKKLLSQAVARSLKNNIRVAEIKCANQEVYQIVKDKLSNAYLGYEILTENHCYSSKARYSSHDNLRLIEIYY